MLLLFSLDKSTKIQKVWNVYIYTYYVDAIKTKERQDGDGVVHEIKVHSM